MKFQSVIAPIMHKNDLAARAGLIFVSLLSLLQAACMGISEKKHTYSASSPAVRVNGADICMQVKPIGSDGGSYMVSLMVVGGGSVTMDGPFHWRLVAMGQDGKQQSITVHRLLTKTSKTHRNEWYPTEHIGKAIAFKPLKSSPGTTRAIYPIPGQLRVKPREDGELEVTADVTITGNNGSERKLVKFRMAPSDKKKGEILFIPTEIVKSIGKSSDDWDLASWD